MEDKKKEIMEEPMNSEDIKDDKENKNKSQGPEETLNELTNLLKRTQANFENYRKQTEKRVEEIHSMAAKNIILQILPAMDNFELALKNANHTNNSEDFIKGVELIYSQLFGVLEDNGIKVIESEKQKFDPFFHEALMKVDSEEDENIIIEEFQKGFTLNNKVIRHAKVKVSSGRKPECKE